MCAYIASLFTFNFELTYCQNHVSKRKCVLPAPPAVATRIVHRFLKVGQNARPVPIPERAGEKRHEAAVVAAVATCTSSSRHNIRQWHGGPCLCVALLARPRPTLQLTLHSILRLREPPFSRAGGREETGRSRERARAAVFARPSVRANSEAP